MKGLCLLLTIIACFGYHVTAQGNGAVRLNGDSSNTNGVVEVFVNNQWSQVCDYGTSSIVSDVVCHQLGYTLSSSTTETATGSNFISSVTCSSFDQVLLQCFYNTDSSCTLNNVVSVNCYGSRVWDSFVYTGRIRLQDGDYSNQGRVEVYCNGQWGGICQDFTYSSEIASTICYQLGYDNVDSVTASSSTGTIWLNGVNCNTNTHCVGYCTSGNCPTTEVTTCTAGSAFITCSSTGSGAGGGERDVCIIPNFPTGAAVAIVIVSILLFIGCLASVIGIPICICCCLGIGIGAAASSGSRRYEAI